MLKPHPRGNPLFKFRSQGYPESARRLGRSGAMIASTASASETENTIFMIVWPTRHLMVRSEGDWRVSFAKCVTSASGAGIAEGPQPTGDLTVSRGKR
jgi:hypothetical protein